MTKHKDILKANPVLTKPEFAEQLRQWAKKEEEKNNETRRDDSCDSG